MSRNQDLSTRSGKISRECLNPGRWVMPTRRPAPKAPSEKSDGQRPTRRREDWRRGWVVAEDENLW